MIPRKTPRAAWFRLVSVALALGLGACSATRLAYNNLDSLLAWQLGRFLDLGDEQRAIVDRAFPPLWNWHRSTQLPLYVKDLRALRDAAQQPLTRGEVEHFSQRARDHLVLLWRELLPDLTLLLKSLDDAQARRVMERMAEWRAEQAAEWEGLTEDQRKARLAKEMEEGLERWLGDLTRAQRDRVRAWAAARRSDPAVERAYRENWARAFADTLAHRKDAAFEERARTLMTEPDVEGRAAVLEVREHNRRAWIDLAVDLSANLSDYQRRHFRDELEDLAEDLESLAAKAVSAPDS